MPASIPTYLATQFVKNTSLATRMNTLKRSYQYQYISYLSIASIFNVYPISDVANEFLFLTIIY
jgi:hypothetical protein